MTVANQYPYLYQLFGAYFHEDWRLDDSTPDEVIERMKRENGADTISAAVKELDKLLATGDDDTDLAERLTLLGCEYYPPGDNVGYREWLVHVKSRLTS